MDDLKYDVLDGKIDKIDAKIDKILEHSASTDATLAGQAEQIRYHIKRTDLVELEVKSIKDHINVVNAVTKVAGVAIGSSGIIFGVLKYLKLV
jgi:hypothetical protein